MCMLLLYVESLVTLSLSVCPSVCPSLSLCLSVCPSVGSDKVSAVRDLADGAVEVGVAADDLCVSVQSLSSAQCRLAVLPAAIPGSEYFTCLMYICMYV